MGGVLKNSKGERFMFNYIPDLFRSETAADAAEAERWLRKEEGARRPPELLTRDVVARAIVREVKEGRGSPHGGAFLDIASRRDTDYIKRKLPSMYHQFKELGGVDITKEPMEVGPTAHYIMGGVRVDANTQMSTVPGLFAAGESAGGLHGSNRLGGNSLSDLVVFGRLAGQHAAEHARGLKKHTLNEAEIEALVTQMYEPFNRTEGENAFLLTEELETTMEANVGIARTEEELKHALSELEKLSARSQAVRVTGDCRFNPGWHQALSLRNMLVCSRAVAMGALERKESRGAHMRVDYQATDPEYGKWNYVIRRDHDGQMTLSREALPKVPPELAALLEDKAP